MRLLLIFILLSLASCTAIREIKFAGGYEGVTGEVTLVLTETESALEKSPVLDKINDTGGRENVNTSLCVLSAHQSREVHPSTNSRTHQHGSADT